MQKAVSTLLQIGLYVVGSLLTTGQMSSAQVTSDNTVNTQVNQKANVAEITGGTTRGSNLFHSFQDFSVPAGNEAFFNNANSISNIFSRVTGGNISNVNGLIRANGSANLFLVNPAGIMFNDGARLDIGGSFYGSTASSILFENGEFSATNLEQPPLLTVNAPIGLGFRDNPGNITQQGSSLSVLPGKNLSLLGGKIAIDAGNLNAKEGQVSLGAISSLGVVNLDENLSLDFNTLLLADILLDNGATINVAGAGEGKIAINARNLKLSDNSTFNAGIDANTSTLETRAGNIIVNASQSVILETGSELRNNLNVGSLGNAGDIIVTAQNLSLSDDSDLITAVDAKGNAGNINLNITDEIFLDKEAGIISQVRAGGVGDSGNIIANSSSVTLDNNSIFTTNVIGRGNGGNILVDSNSTVLNNGSLFSADISGEGESGNINVITNTLTLKERAFFSAKIAGRGNGGNINIQASERVTLENSFVQALVESEGVGDAGNISIATDSLLLTRGIQDASSFILSSTSGRGNAGDITVEALNDINLENGSSFITSVEPGGEGKGGDINLTATNISLIGKTKDNRSELRANTRGIGDAGNIVVNALGKVSLAENSTINNKSVSGRGDAGNIKINSERLFIDGRSFILNDNGNPEIPNVTNIGNSGDVTIDSQIVSLDNQSQISSSSFANTIGEAGDIAIDTDNLIIAKGSNIGNLTENDSDGGEIKIDARNIELVTGGTIASTTSSTGNAGNIILNVAQQIAIDGENPFIPSEDSRFTVQTLQELEPFTGLFANTTIASSGDGGNIKITNPQVLLLSNGGEIAVNSQGTGSSGNLSITADSLELNKQSQLIAETKFGQTEPRPSNINLFIDDVLTLRGDSLISASALNNANGGNVNIDADLIIAYPARAGGNDIIANAAEGLGGNISITTEGILGIEERPQSPDSNDLDASSQVDGLDGTVTITNPSLNLFRGVVELPSNVVESDEVTAQACEKHRARTNENLLNISGSGGIPPEPSAPLDSFNVTANETIAQASIAPQSVTTSQGEIEPARGIEVTESGNVVLTAYQTNNSGDRLPKVRSNCS